MVLANATNVYSNSRFIVGAMSATRFVDVGLFQDVTAGALTASVMGSGAAETWFNGSLSYKMVSGTTSATTFRIRIGPNAAGNVYVNGSSGGRVFGGVASTTLEIWEIAT